MTTQSTSLWAFLGVPPSDDSGVEGIVAVDVGGGTTPMVTSAEEDLEQMRPMVQRAVDGSGVSVRLVRFGAPEELEVFRPATESAH
jgi:hypothetical protein